MAKLARGVGFCCFGEKALSGEYAEEIGRAIWLRPGDPTPDWRGSGFLGEKDRRLTDLLGHPHAVVLGLVNFPEGVALNLALGQADCATVLCVAADALNDDDRRQIGHGMVILVFPFMRESVVLTLPEYVAHKLGKLRHSQLERIERSIPKFAWK